MKQALYPITPAFESKIVEGNDLTEEEMTEQLVKSYKGAIMLSADKKEFLLDLLKNKSDILEQCKLFDSIITDSSLFSAISSLLPENTRVVNHDCKNRDLAVMVSKLLIPLKLLHSYVHSQYEEEMKRKAQLRSSTHDKQKRSPVKVLLDKAVDLHKKLEVAVMQQRSVPTISSVVKKQVTLSTLQRQRKWDQERVPVAKQLQFCANCGHKSTNIPIENEEIKAYNKSKADEHSKNTKLWDGYMKKVAAGEKDTRKPANLSRRPNRRTFKEPIIMCMCATSFCLGNFDTKRNGCPIKCLKNEVYTNQVIVKKEDNITSEKKNVDSDAKYEFSGDPKSCTCPICSCHCRFACRISDVPSILIQKSLEKNREGEKEFVEDPFSKQEETVQPFLSNIMKDAMKMCWKKWNEEKKNVNLDPFHKFDSDIHERIENRGVTAGCHNAAVNIVASSPNVSLKERLAWREGLGKPTSKVCLPSGDTFNTRMLSSNDKHASNNKLGTKAEIQVQKGMKSNLKIDYSNQCKDYTDFISGNTKAIKTPWEKERHKKFKKEIQFDIGSSSSDSSDDCVIIELPKKKSAEVTQKPTNDEVIMTMHQRVVSRARTQLTRKIKETLDCQGNNDTPDTTAGRKSNIRKLKQVIQLLESSELSNTNLNSIRSVTNDGLDLVSNTSLSLKSISSSEVLERLEVFYEIE